MGEQGDFGFRLNSEKGRWTRALCLCHKLCIHVFFVYTRVHTCQARHRSVPKQHVRNTIGFEFSAPAKVAVGCREEVCASCLSKVTLGAERDFDLREGGSRITAPSCQRCAMIRKNAALMKALGDRQRRRRQAETWFGLPRGRERERERERVCV